MKPPVSADACWREWGSGGSGLEDQLGVGGGVHRQVAAFGQVLAEQAVGVLVGAALPG